MMETVAIIETHNYGVGITLNYDAIADIGNLLLITSQDVKIAPFNGVMLIGADYLELAQFFARHGLLLDIDEVQTICETFDDHLDKVVSNVT